MSSNLTDSWVYHYDMSGSGSLTVWLCTNKCVFSALFGIGIGDILHRISTQLFFLACSADEIIAWSAGHDCCCCKAIKSTPCFLSPAISPCFVKNTQQGILPIVSMKAASVVLYKHLLPEDKYLYGECEENGEKSFENSATYCTFPATYCTFPRHAVSA